MEMKGEEQAGVIFPPIKENTDKRILSLFLSLPLSLSRIDTSTLPRIAVDGTSLPYVSELRNLGVVMCSNLSWRSQVLSISRRVHFSLHRLKYHRNILSREPRTTLVTSLIFPILDYCCRVYKDLTDELNTMLQQLRNCGIRFIFDLRWDVHISLYRKILRWLTVRSRRL